jgi:hypothetical protein
MRNRGRNIVHHHSPPRSSSRRPLAGVAGQQPDPGVDSRPINVELDPIACWWRTSVAAIRVGEPFSIVLTCAVVERALTTVVPDLGSESANDPASRCCVLTKVVNRCKPGPTSTASSFVILGFPQSFVRA